MAQFGCTQGLTKETSSSVAKYANSLTKPKPKWQLDIDDDNKIWRRYSNKRVNAKKDGLGFELSFEEYCLLVKEAGLKSSQLGFTGDNYVLARYNDSGPYKYGNCRFITQQENYNEKVRSYAETHNGIEAARKKLRELREIKKIISGTSIKWTSGVQIPLLQPKTLHGWSLCSGSADLDLPHLSLMCPRGDDQKKGV